MAAFIDMPPLVRRWRQHRSACD